MGSPLPGCAKSPDLRRKTARSERASGRTVTLPRPCSPPSSPLPRRSRSGASGGRGQARPRACRPARGNGRRGGHLPGRLPPARPVLDARRRLVHGRLLGLRDHGPHPALALDVPRERGLPPGRRDRSRDLRGHRAPVRGRPRHRVPRRAAHPRDRGRHRAHGPRHRGPLVDAAGQPPAAAGRRRAGVRDRHRLHPGSEPRHRKGRHGPAAERVHGRLLLVRGLVRGPRRGLPPAPRPVDQPSRARGLRLLLRDRAVHRDRDGPALHRPHAGPGGRRLAHRRDLSGVHPARVGRPRRRALHGKGCSRGVGLVVVGVAFVSASGG